MCRDATLLRAAEASLEYAAAANSEYATRAAATKVNLVIGFLHGDRAKRARLLGPSAVNARSYFITRNHQRASASSTQSIVGVAPETVAHLGNITGSKRVSLSGKRAQARRILHGGLDDHFRPFRLTVILSR